MSKASNTDNNNSAGEPEASDNKELSSENNNPSAIPNATVMNNGLGEMMAGNFIEYASYVIKDRAIPDLKDGLKPVQRRILHVLNQMDDGRFHKVANVIGNTMQYHPHGDASIGSALVVLANKEYFIEKQGNFGNIITGDEASAPRYIECRLTNLARDVLFNKEITEYAPSYDGRKQEPVTLPAKIPVVLLLGAEGIAVGMSTRIPPHNFKEVLQAQIAYLENRSFTLYPDYPTGGLMDVSEYENGTGRIKIRARIEIPDKKRLVITELPATKTTETLINSIEEAAKRGKIKIAGINDYTTDKPEIEIKLPRGIYAQDTIKQLYAYTDCEIGLSTSMVVINDDTPEIMTIDDILTYCTDKLVNDLKKELEIALAKYREQYHQKTLVQIFIENRIYKRIEEAKSYEKVMSEVREGLEPYKDKLNREITDDDIANLLKIQIRRISRFDIDQNQQEIDDILTNIEKVKHNLENLTKYTIDYLQNLLDKYADFYPRRTAIDELEDVSAKEVALKNVKIGHDKVGNFVGSEVRNSNKNEDYMVCSEYDRLILLQNNGKFQVIPVPRKQYVGAVKYLLKVNKDQTYSMVYRDRKTGKHYAKRFKIDSFIMNREYKTIPDNCIIEHLYLSSNPLLRCEFKNKTNAAPHMDLDFNEVPVRSRGARGVKISDRVIARFTRLKREEENAEVNDDNNDTTRETETQNNNSEESSTKASENADKGDEADKKFDTDKNTSEENNDAQTEKNTNTSDDSASKSRKKGAKTRIDEDTPFFLDSTN